MKINLRSGAHYIVGVSGGVDSVALLHALAHNSAGSMFVVAHFDHGIRQDSAEDMLFVQELVQKYRMPFETKRVELGAGASEATARHARYEFLNEVKAQYGADAIITAHHQDDLIETALLNVLRGTKRRGFVSMLANKEIVRPLITTPKAEILAYAQEHSLQWREDSTNTDTKYLRNAIRKIIKTSLTAEKRQQIVTLLNHIAEQNKAIDALVDELLVGSTSNEINKKLLSATYLAEGYEIAAEWLRKSHINFDEQTIKRLVIGTRTLQNTAKIDLKDDYYSVVKRDKVVIEHR